MVKSIKAWAGFINGKLDNWLKNQPAIFKTKAAAELRYDDVRRVEIREVK